MKELTENMYQGTVGFINNIMDDGRLFYLYDRWQDEKKYEDFADYIEQTKDFIEEFGLIFVKMTKNFKIVVRNLDTLVEIKINKSNANVTYIGEE
tara:strand:- start:18885 stop:19169 length:285 start_codon:yes stop_codon:yes gene_type:complete